MCFVERWDAEKTRGRRGCCSPPSPARLCNINLRRSDQKAGGLNSGPARSERWRRLCSASWTNTRLTVHSQPPSRCTTSSHSVSSAGQEVEGGWSSPEVTSAHHCTTCSNPGDPCGVPQSGILASSGTKVTAACGACDISVVSDLLDHTCHVTIWLQWSVVGSEGPNGPVGSSP